MKTQSDFENGLLRRELFMGMVSAVSASQARVNLNTAGEPSGSHFESFRYGRGEVGELVLIEGQVSLVLGRLVEVRLPETERKGLAPERTSTDVLGNIQFLGSVRPDTLQVTPGIATYPRLGDRVYAAPHAFVSRIPSLMEIGAKQSSPITLSLGRVGGLSGSELLARPELLFGRHCAVLGATGGGKSWTVAKLVEECSAFEAKVILLDATGEYRSLEGDHIRHCHLGRPINTATASTPCSLPPTAFEESDFIAMFEPSGKVQGPRLRDAIRSLRLVQLEPSLATNNVLIKAKKDKAATHAALKRHLAATEDPRTPFQVRWLAKQVYEECVFPGDSRNWGDYSSNDQTFCLSLVTRIAAITRSEALAPVFRSSNASPITLLIDSFLAKPEARVLRLCLSGILSELKARELIANTLGRMLLTRAREGLLGDKPVLVILDEAHNFLGRSTGSEDSIVRLDSFELIAREGRKFWLNLCLATQRPRDLTEGVLSQMGTLIVHRLTNDRDREIVERSCGEIDRSASAFLPNLKPGEAVIIGADFPIPLTIQMTPPAAKPMSDGPDYQLRWAPTPLQTVGSPLAPPEGTAASSTGDFSASPPSAAPSTRLAATGTDSNHGGIADD